MVSLALALVLAQDPAILRPEAADARRSAIESALRHGSGDLPPIPLQTRSAERGVMFDRFRLAVLAMRDAERAGTPLTREALMRLDLPALLVVANPVTCDGGSTPAASISVTDGRASVDRISTDAISGEDLARLLPGVPLDPDARGASFRRMAGPSSVVVIQYEGGVCGPRDLPVSVSPPKKIKEPPPAWPVGVLGTPAHGPIEVQIRATIGIHGVPEDIAVVSAPSPFNLAAAAAVRQWRYEPMRINGVATPTAMAVTVSFRRR